MFGKSGQRKDKSFNGPNLGSDSDAFVLSGVIECINLIRSLMLAWCHFIVRPSE